MINAGQYFTINRARQYGKTTTLRALSQFLKENYVVVSMDFQKMSDSKFKNENTFSIAFAKYFIKAIETGNNIVSDYLVPLKKALTEENRVNLLFLLSMR